LSDWGQRRKRDALHLQNEGDESRNDLEPRFIDTAWFSNEPPAEHLPLRHMVGTLSIRRDISLLPVSSRRE
jgi:hypothetical protein